MTSSAHRSAVPRLMPAAIAPLLCLCSPATFGNGGPIDDSDGNQIAPLSSNEVQLVRESVRVSFHAGYYGWVRCCYLLRNRMPREAELSIAFVRGQEMTNRGHEFRAWVEDRPAEVRWMRADLDRWRAYAGGDLDSLPVWDLRIPAEDTLTVRCEYPVRFSGGFDGGGVRNHFSYRTKAAALWAGFIESADLEIDLGDDWRLFLCDDYRVPPYVQASIEPPGYRWHGTLLHWRFENWEPAEDVVIDLYKADVLMWEDFMDCRALSEVDCDYLIDLPPYAGDTLLYAQEPLIEAIRDGFVSQWFVHPIARNYEAFAHAYLEAMLLEIPARHGAPLTHYILRRFFDAQGGWYSPDPAYDRSRLNATEQANEQVLRALQQRIADRPEMLLPLPARR